MFDVGYFPRNTPPDGSAEWPIKARYLKATRPLSHNDVASIPRQHHRGFDMTRIIEKLFAVAAVLTALLPIAPLAAAPVTLTFVASAGSDNNACTPMQPCASLSKAVQNVASGGQTTCLDPTGSAFGPIVFATPSYSLTIDCPGTIVPSGFGLALGSTNQVFKIRNLTFDGALASGGPAIEVTGSGTLILENCVFENFSGVALDIEPSGALNLVMKNSRVSNNTGGVLIKPAAGGSVTATFDGDTIVNNTGGLRTDSTNGNVKVDVSNSTTSNNTANGMVVIGGAGGTNMVTLKSDVIASNGQAGIVANGSMAAVLVNNTVLDSNTTGATSVASGGRILTYGNNSTIGLAGSGFTGTAPLN
jgi:Right handed beta helix region